MKKIIIGWAKSYGLLPSSEAEKKLSDLRLQICGECSDAKESSILKLLNGTAEYYPVLKCTRCSCPCVQKSIVVAESCPIGKW